MVAGAAWIYRTRKTKSNTPCRLQSPARVNEKERSNHVCHRRLHTRNKVSRHYHEKRFNHQCLLRALIVSIQGARFRHSLPIGLSATKSVRWINACPQAPNNIVGLTTASETGHHNQHFNSTRPIVPIINRDCAPLIWHDRDPQCGSCLKRIVMSSRH